MSNKYMVKLNLKTFNVKHTCLNVLKIVFKKMEQLLLF